ncbi:predicted protein [Aspergillus terreus NIH2624]|uniref:Pentatricopeptide repeat protein n=1 Tax=Aspergillus terreus (strain NIH 2624 / FGSC A1156) TaxID=341663 RepID=Q0CXT6_ASPTN|nr:uncharacterized protein ATEG_01498 [Aspergillus terreus NIH2624]EAU38255.1 predicted protein [Aspergillus terreus NIH2624]
MAVRIARWPRAVWRAAPVVPVSSAGRSLSRAAIPSPIDTSLKSADTRRWYSSESSPPIEHADEPRTNAPKPSLTEASKRPEGAGDDLDPLMGVAMAGSSPKIREQDAAFFGRSVSSKVVELELKWLKDPRALADRVARLLSADDVPLAAALVRSAQKERMECSVAWNHLLEYCMNKRAPRAAFKFYNDVCCARVSFWLYGGCADLVLLVDEETRPETEFPDVHDHVERSQQSREELGPQPGQDGLFYISVDLGVQLHCRAEHYPRKCDAERLLAFGRYGYALAGGWRASRGWSRLAGSNYVYHYSEGHQGCHATGRRRYAVTGRSADLDRKTQGVTEGKRVWSDIIYQWGKGRLALDNQLVGAMGTLLLEGASDRDCYDVFALIHQTTGVPILAKEPPKSMPKRSSTSRLQEDTGLQEEVEDVPFVDEGNRLYRPSEPEQEASEELEEEEENFDNLFDPVISPDAAKPKEGGDEVGPSYLTVGNRELSMIMEACLSMTQGLSTGKAYWNYLTREDHDYKIDPDSGSFHQYLRLLRLGRSSRATVEVIRDQMVPSGVLEGRTFHIAMSCCRRDRNNINVLKNSNELLKLMDEHLVLPDPKALEGYLELIRVLEDNPHLLVSLNGLNTDEKLSSSSLGRLGRELQFRLRQVAIDQLRPHVSKLDKAMEHGASIQLPGGNRKSRKPDPNSVHAVRGPQALKVLVQARGLIDTTLKPENASLLSKTLREQLEKDSMDLRKYSDASVMKMYKGLMISPTPEQVLAFEDRARD